LVRALVDLHGLDALILANADFFQFAANFGTDVQTWERPVLCVVPRNGPLRYPEWALYPSGTLQDRGREALGHRYGHLCRAFWPDALRTAAAAMA
jgi:hypothetical protein